MSQNQSFLIQFKKYLIYEYTRFSTQHQELNRELDLLENEKCLKILTEKIAGTQSSRPALDRLKDKLRPGDTVIVENKGIHEKKEPSNNIEGSFQ